MLKNKGQISKGLITKGIRELESADVAPSIYLNGGRPKLIVIENGYTRCLPISRQVAEVLIANGFSYGS